MKSDDHLERLTIKWVAEKVREKPGVSTNWLYENRPHGFPELAAFDRCLARARDEEGLRTTNKVWWPKGYIGTKTPKASRKKTDNRQLSLVGTGENK